ncbi:MAG: SPOR domain-containing protein, partial [Acidobacteriota bacterium]
TAAAVMAAPSAPPPTVAPEPPPPTAAPATSAVAGTRAGRWVQVAALSRNDLAAGVRHRVVALGFTPGQVVIQAEGGKYRVRLGPFPDQESARRVEARLKAEGFPDAFVVKPGE